jgi:glycosyltransferase involved in cell wall biosynthesis
MTAIQQPRCCSAPPPTSLPRPATGLSVTVIVPVRDEELSIRGVIDSLVKQTLPPQEIIITDAGSLDSTKDVIREFIQANHPLRLVEDADAFPGRARNLAIEQVKTVWVAMTDAGTVIPSTWLESLFRKAGEQDRTDVVYGSYEPILGTFFQDCLALAFVPPARNVDGCPYRGPTTASLMLRREVWNALGRFPEQLRACEDLLFFELLSASSCVSELAPEAPVGWKMPEDWRAVFRRFRLYSLHTLKAGLGRSWHRALGRNVSVGLLLASLGVFHHWAWLGVPLLAIAWRVHRSIRTRRPWLKLHYPVGFRSYLLVGLILLWIDLGALAGCVDYLLQRWHAGNPPRGPVDR